MFSPRGAASCPPCWKLMPVTDSGRLSSGGGRVPKAARHAGPAAPGPSAALSGSPARSAGGLRPPPFPSPRAAPRRVV